jgi:diamine N-acetyltransferase
MPTLPVSLREVTDENRGAVCALVVDPGQERFVSSVAESLDEAAATPEAAPWYRAIYADDEPVGFVMLSWDTKPAPGILGPYFLWRILIDRHHQRHGYGRDALAQVVDLLRADGARELLTSYHPGDGEPWPFYRRFGFEPTGEIEDGEIVLRLDLARDGID